MFSSINNIFPPRFPKSTKPEENASNAQAKKKSENATLTYKFKPHDKAAEEFEILAKHELEDKNTDKLKGLSDPRLIQLVLIRQINKTLKTSLLESLCLETLDSVSDEKIMLMIVTEKLVSPSGMVKLNKMSAAAKLATCKKVVAQKIFDNQLKRITGEDVSTLTEPYLTDEMKEQFGKMNGHEQLVYLRKTLSEQKAVWRATLKAKVNDWVFAGAVLYVLLTIKIAEYGTIEKIPLVNYFFSADRRSFFYRGLRTVLGINEQNVLDRVSVKKALMCFKNYVLEAETGELYGNKALDLRAIEPAIEPVNLPLSGQIAGAISLYANHLDELKQIIKPTIRLIEKTPKEQADNKEPSYRKILAPTVTVVKTAKLELPPEYQKKKDKNNKERTIQDAMLEITHGLHEIAMQPTFAAIRARGKKIETAYKKSPLSEIEKKWAETEKKIKVRDYERKHYIIKAKAASLRGKSSDYFFADESVAGPGVARSTDVKSKPITATRFFDAQNWKLRSKPIVETKLEKHKRLLARKEATVARVIAFRAPLKNGN